MNGFKTALVLCLLSAIALCAAWAPGASANQIYLCESTNNAAFADAHCLVAGSGNGFFHKVITGKIGITGSNAKTLSGTTASSTAKLRGTAGGVETEVQCTTVGGSGTVENQATWGQGTGVLEYTGCSVTKPAGKGCVVNSGAVTTKELFATTQGLTNQVKFTPAGESTEFASVTIEGCSVAGLNKTFPVTGSLIANTSGGTTTATHAEVTTQNTLKFAGQKAGLDGSVTLCGVFTCDALAET